MASTGRGSKTKGSSYERKTAKRLGEWWGDEFQRTPASGGLRWKSDNNVIGDIVASPSANFPFVVECKHQEGGWTLESVFLNRHNIREWYAQVVFDGRRGNKTPLLMFTRNYAEDFVMLPFSQEVYDTLEDKNLPVMRTHIMCEDDMTGTKERFDVLVTTLDGLTSFDKEYWIANPMEDWEERTLLEVIKEEEVVETEDDMADNLSGLLGKLKNI